MSFNKPYKITIEAPTRKILSEALDYFSNLLREIEEGDPQLTLRGKSNFEDCGINANAQNGLGFNAELDFPID